MGNVVALPPVQGGTDPSLVPILEQGYKLWRVVNERRHGGRLPAPVLVIASNSRLKDANRLGWCSTDRVWTKAKTQEQVGAAAGAFEVGLASEHLHRSVEAICVTWLHEFAHYGNWSQGIVDANPNTQYHNKRFKEECERLGLEVFQVNGRGWAGTKAGPAARQLIADAGIDESVFTWVRLGQGGGAGRKKQPTKMKKWACACTNVRCAVDLAAICTKCGQPFVNQTPEEEED